MKEYAASAATRADRDAIVEKGEELIAPMIDTALLDSALTGAGRVLVFGADVPVGEIGAHARQAFRAGEPVDARRRPIARAPFVLRDEAFLRFGQSDVVVLLLGSTVIDEAMALIQEVGSKVLTVGPGDCRALRQSCRLLALMPVASVPAQVAAAFEKRVHADALCVLEATLSGRGRSAHAFAHPK